MMIPVYDLCRKLAIANPAENTSMTLPTINGPAAGENVCIVSPKAEEPPALPAA
jgi:hypothetical protein